MKPQDVTGTPGGHAIFMVFSLRPEPDAAEKVKALCADFAALSRSMRTRFPGCGASGVMGFGATAWGRLFPKYPRPKELEVFREIRGSRYTAVSTPGDLFFHLRAERMDVCQEMATLIGQALKDAVIPVDEVQGFRYFDGRAIVGFVDGTENPENEERAEWAVIGDEDAAFQGGSYAFVQKYLHDIASKRNTMVSTGDRSAKIRTYNFPQGRMTDHRINFSIYNLADFMDGNIQECIDRLIIAENAEKLKASEL